MKDIAAFKQLFPTICAKLSWDIDDLPFSDFSWAVAVGLPITHCQDRALLPAIVVIDDSEKYFDL